MSLTITEDRAEYTTDDFTLTVTHDDFYGGDKPRWIWVVTDSEDVVLTAGNDLHGHGDAREMLASLADFLSADAEKYRRVMGPITDPHEDGYLFGEDVAAWAYDVSDELSLIGAELGE